MKKLIATTLIVLGFAAAVALPDFEIKIVEKSAVACDDPSCN